MSSYWKIVENPADTTFGLRVLSNQEDEAWPYFFNGIMPSAYPELLRAAADRVGYDSNGTGITFSSDLDAFDHLTTSLADDVVEIYVPGFDDSLLPRATFYAVLLAFAKRLLERAGQPDGWDTAMRSALTTLQTKIAAG